MYLFNSRRSFSGGRVLARFWTILVLLAGVVSPVYAQDTAELQKRVQQLEQQLVDMQVVIGTLESLAGASAGSGAAATPPTSGGVYGGGGNAYGGGGVDSGRLDSMETQIRALSAQMEQLSRDIRGGGVGRRGDAGGASAYGGASNYASTEPQFNGRTSRQAPVAQGGFGSTTVTPADGGGRGAATGDPIGGYLSGGLEAAGSGAGAGGWNSAGSQQVARAPIGNDDAKSIYETAYGYLLQQDYTSAESAFGDFVSRFPKDKLASNAQYWLGETYFVRGQYKSAAGAFLKGYETYRSGSKAPDSLLKLAMSLEKLGQKDAACSSLSELTVRFPQAPQHVKRKAQSERGRFGC